MSVTLIYWTLIKEFVCYTYRMRVESYKVLTLNKYLIYLGLLRLIIGKEPERLWFISSTVPPSHQWKDCVCVWNELYLLEKLEEKECLPLRVFFPAWMCVWLALTDPELFESQQNSGEAFKTARTPHPEFLIINLCVQQGQVSGKNDITFCCYGQPSKDCSRWECCLAFVTFTFRDIL